MIKILSIFLCISFFLISCSQVRQSAGVNRKNIDEFKVVENPPLVIPPDFNLLPPEQLLEKNIENAEKDLAQEILFGLNENKNIDKTEVSTMVSILNKTEANVIDDTIRQEIDEQFASEKKFNLNIWDNEDEILDSIAESERLRNQRIGENSQKDEDIPVAVDKNKKKKRFFFF